MSRRLHYNLALSREASAKWGFTLIEVLMVIVIIGILATLSMVSLTSARGKAVDVKRLSDVQQMQYALDRFFEDTGSYPPNIDFIPGTAFSNPVNPSKMYLDKIPENPSPKAGGVCPEEYKYQQGTDGRSYVLTYCLLSKVSDLSPGVCSAMPGIICTQSTTCSCVDNSQPCCAYCPGDSTCIH